MLNNAEIAAEVKIRILFAEDEPSNQLLIERMLTKGGYNVTTVNDGREALDYLDSNLYDLCIFDMEMPVMTGIEAVELYKSKQPQSKLPFIILTANIEKEAIEKCKKAGADIHLAKPIIYKTLIEAITTAIGTRSPVSMSDESSIDITQLGNYEDSEFLDEFIKIFIVSAEKLINSLADLLNDDFDGFMRSIHSIKGLSGNIGAKTLRQLTITAEKMNAEDYRKLSSEHFDLISDELENVKKELKSFLSTENTEA